MRKTNDEEILKMLKEGKTQRKIAQHFGVSEPAISKRVKRLLPPPKSLENLTDKEQKFVLEVASGKTQTDAAMVSHDCISRDSAKSMGSHLMAKSDIQLAVSEIMQQEGLTKRYRVRKLKTHVDAKDPGISLKALDQSWRLDGEYKEHYIQEVIIYADLEKSLEEIEKEIEIEKAKIAEGGFIEAEVIEEDTEDSKE